jgi:hypothetical protein
METAAAGPPFSFARAGSSVFKFVSLRLFLINSGGKSVIPLLQRD